MLAAAPIRHVAPTVGRPFLRPSLRGLRGLGGQPIADAPPTVVRPFHGPADTVREMIKAIVGPRGEQSTLVRSLKDHIIRDIQPKDYLSEILAVRFFVHEKVKYSNDALGVEQVSDPERSADQIVKFGKAVEDCDGIATLMAALCRQLGREVEIVIVGFGRPGSYSHVFIRVKEPKSGTWIVLDPVAGTDEASMLRRVTTYQIWKLP
jgi:transglutaminase-like putative cysteine protease